MPEKQKEQSPRSKMKSKSKGLKEHIQSEPVGIPVVAPDEDEIQEETLEEEDEYPSELSDNDREFESIKAQYCKFYDNPEIREQYSTTVPLVSRMFDFLTKTFESEKRANERCRNIEKEVDFATFMISKTMREFAEGTERIAVLQKERDEARKMVDIVSAQELSTQEAIEECSRRVLRLTEENNNKQKAIETMELAKNDRDMIEHIQKVLKTEVETLQEQLHRSLEFQHGLERQNSVANLQIGELKLEIEGKYEELNNRQKENISLEERINSLKELLQAKEEEILSTANELAFTKQNITRLETSLREEHLQLDEVIRDLTKCKTNLNRKTSELEDEYYYRSKLEQEIIAKEEQLKVTTDKLHLLENELAKCKHIESTLQRKIEKEKRLVYETTAERDKLNERLEGAQTDLKLARTQLTESEANAKDMALGRDKLSAALTVSNMSKQKLSQVIRMMEKVQGQLELDFTNCVSEKLQMAKIINDYTQKEDNLQLEKEILLKQVQKMLDELKIQQLDVKSYRLSLAETEAKLREEQKAHENVRMEKNVFKNNLIIAQNENSDLRLKIAMYSRQLKQQREEISSKEADLNRGVALLEKCQDAKQNINIQLQKSKNQLHDRKATIKSLEEMVQSLHLVIRKGEAENQKKQRIIDQVMSARDVLGAQLVRRNDEVALLYEKIRIISTMMHKGEQQYQQRLEDIRLLKIEVKRLRQELTAREKNMDNAVELKNSILHLQRDLTTAQQRVVVLEEELKTPLNIHRWRKLESLDPDAFQLAQKVRLLQRRLLEQSAKALQREEELRETLALYGSLKTLVLRQPGADTIQRLDAAQRALRKKERQLKVLTADLAAQLSLVKELREDDEKMKNEVQRVKEKYFKLKNSDVKSTKGSSCVSNSVLLPKIHDSKVSRHPSSLLQSMHSMMWQ